MILCMQFGIVLDAIDPGMGADVIRHVVEVIGPHIDEILVLTIELHTYAVDIRLMCVIIDGAATLQKILHPVVTYDFDRVCHMIVTG